MGIVTIVNCDWVLNPERPVVDLTDIRRVSNSLKKLAPGTATAIRFGCLPKPSGTEYLIAPIVYSIMAGLGIRETAPAAASRIQFKWASTGLREQLLVFERWLEPVNARSVTAGFATLLQLNDPFAPIRKAIVANEAFDRDAWKSTVEERRQRLYCLQTLCPLDKLLMATGELAPQLDGALTQATRHARILHSKSDKPLHRDEVIHFWLEYYARRVEKPFIPFVKYR